MLGLEGLVSGAGCGGTAAEVPNVLVVHVRRIAVLLAKVALEGDAGFGLAPA